MKGALVVERAFRLNGVSIPEVVRQLNTDGIVCLRNTVSEQWLNSVRADLPNYRATHGEGDFLLIDAGDQPNTPSHEFVSTPELHDLFAAVTAAAWPQAARPQHARSGLTVRNGSARKAPASLFHYDASVVTMVVPVVIPVAELGSAADLVAIPNRRPFRRYLISHVVDKLLTHNRLYRKRIAREALRHPERHIVNLEPGNVYLFWGYRTLHGNLPCAPGLLRVTLVLQYSEVHSPSPVLSLVRRVRLWQLRKYAGAAVASEGPRPTLNNGSVTTSKFARPAPTTVDGCAPDLSDAVAD